MNKRNIIISLTSYPVRINTLYQTIESILNQSLKADKIVLWLSEEEFPNKEKCLSENLLKLKEENNNFEIDWCKNNIKSFNKLIPALKKYSNSIIVTADDDIIYPENWLELLFEAYIKEPDLIHCHRAHRLKFNKKKLLPYMQWDWVIKNAKPSFNNFLTGVGGVLYPPKSLHNDVFKEELFTKLAPQADDIWFWAMAVLNNTKINIIENNISNLNFVAGTQDQNCLSVTNCINNQNDIQLQNVLKYYPSIYKRLDKDNKQESKCFLQNIFSVRNEDIHKIITILGIKLQFKSKKLIEKRKFEDINNKLIQREIEIRDLSKRINVLEDKLG